MSRFISLPSISEPSKNPRSSMEERGGSRTAILPTFQELVARESLKKVSLWFESWRDWQRRVFVCRVMEGSSRGQLRVLATVLEPVLHIDFSSSLVPHLASLHVDGSATFQVQRGVLRRVLYEPEWPERETSTCAHLPSLPTTLASSESGKYDGGSVTCDETGRLTIGEEKNEILRPALPLTHPQHAQISQNSSLEETLGLRHTRFSSVPDFQSTTNLLRDVKRKDLLRPRHHKRSRSLGSYHRLTKSRTSHHQKQQEAEKFKIQLASVSELMSAKLKSQLLLELVKLCNKELLAYFVQCLYQRLQEQIGLDSLSDSLILKIFSYLDPVMLCRCAQVCQRWNSISNSAWLWEEHCRDLGRREGVGDLVTPVRSVCGLREGGVVNWKLAYKELTSVIAQIRQLVLNTVAEKEEREREMEERNAAACMTKSALRARLSLREMIDLARTHSHIPLSTIQEVLGSAPESATTVRRRHRRERQAMEEERLRQESERALSSRYQHRRPYDRSNPSSRMEGLIVTEEESRRSVHHPHRSTSPDIIDLIQEAQDRRSGLRYLPNPDGVRCLVLAGCLLADQPHKPGKTAPIPRLRRLPPLYSTVLCLQCDQKKIVCGTQNREIDVFDIRSGRHVSTLTGHKGSVQCLQFDDDKIVSGSWDSTCIVWDVVHGSVIQELAGHTGCVSCLRFCDEKLVTGSLDKSLRVWSTSTWECIAVISQAHNGPVTCLAFDGSIIASGGHDRCVKIWSPNTYKLLASLPHPTTLTSLLVSKLLLVSACQSGSIKLWSLTPYTSTTRGISRPSRALLPTNPEGVGSLVTHWQLDDGVYLTHMVLEGDKIFACGSGRVIYEWDIATGMFTRSLTGHTRPLTCLSVTESKIVSAAEDHTVCIWYYKKTKNMYKAGTAELLMEQSDPTFPDIPIRVITA